MDPQSAKNRILDALYDGAATSKDIAAELTWPRRLVERVLFESYKEGLVTRKLFVRYRASVYMYDLARSKRSGPM